MEFIEMRIKEAVRELLAGPVNEMLATVQFHIPYIEFNEKLGGDGICPILRLKSCERTEKERVLRLDAYTVEIEFAANGEDGELNCYVYGAMTDRALGADRTLGGIAERVLITGKKYVEPKNGGADEWRLVLTVRVTTT